MELTSILFINKNVNTYRMIYTIKSNIVLLLLFLISLAVNGQEKIILSTRNSSLVLLAKKGEELKFGYYGEKISPKQLNDLNAAGLLTKVPAYPAFGLECRAEAAIQVRHADGNLSVDLAVEEVIEKEGVTSIRLKDRVYPLEVFVNYRPHPDSDIMEVWADIVNQGKKPVVLKRFDSAFLPVRRGDVWISHLHGAWGAEAYLTNEPLVNGMKVIKNMDGVRNSTDDHAEIMLSLDGKPQENMGRVIGAALCWTGNYKFRIDTDNNRYHRLFAGINEEVSEYTLSAKETFSTPKLALTYSNEGLNGASRNFHRWARAGQIHGGDKFRDILLNSWEGVYFNINEEKMKQMIKDFAELGGELFVMDDGWFGEKYPRKNDQTSLGDWKTDRQKLPNGIGALVEAAKSNGIKFGIWIEPEMTNRESELYEKHPDWVIHQSNRPISYGRGGGQMVLDLSNPKVQDFIFNIVEKLMTEYPDIAYIKWDANMTLANYGSSYLTADKQSHLYIDYQRGLQKVVERIRTSYPNLVMQACASGGGRVNYGILPGFDEFWTSDNTDALQRIYMQWGTSYFFPAIAMACHVSTSPNHQTHRSIPMKFRFDVAMTGRLGMEMQPKDMTNEEKEFAKQAILNYKSIRPVVQMGDLYRLISPYDKIGVSSLMYVTPEKNRAVFFCYKLEHFLNQALPRFMMSGLDPEGNYRIRELNVWMGEKPCSLDGKTVSGKLLMSAGIELPLHAEYSSRVLELIKE